MKPATWAEDFTKQGFELVGTMKNPINLTLLHFNRRTAEEVIPSFSETIHAKAIDPLMTIKGRICQF